VKVLTIEHETDTAHRLASHPGKCFNLHGHRYKFVVSVDVKGTIEDGDDFLDFYDFKKKVRELLDEMFDHAIMLSTATTNEDLINLLLEQRQKVLIMHQEPTVEYMLDFVVHEFERPENFGDSLRSITIYETPTNYCTWIKEK